MLQSVFKITIGEPNSFVGLEIDCGEDDGSISIKVSAFIERMLTRFNMSNCIGHKIRADPSVCLTDPQTEPIREVVPYRELVGSLIFATTAARPDIAYITNVLSRNLHNFGKIHWNAAKRVLKYLKDTKNLGIKYSAANNLDIIGYSDSDFAGELQSRRSTTGYVFKINESAVTCRTQREKCVPCSTAEAEYVATSEACKEAIWLNQLLNELGEHISAIKLCVDNQSELKLIKNHPVFHHRSKHIDVRYHFIREKYNNKDINLVFVPSKSQIADIFTKALPFCIFNIFRNLMGMFNVE